MICAGRAATNGAKIAAGDDVVDDADGDAEAKMTTPERRAHAMMMVLALILHILDRGRWICIPAEVMWENFLRVNYDRCAPPWREKSGGGSVGWNPRFAHDGNGMMKIDRGS